MGSGAACGGTRKPPAEETTGLPNANEIVSSCIGRSADTVSPLTNGLLSFLVNFLVTSDFCLHGNRFNAIETS